MTQSPGRCSPLAEIERAFRTACSPPRALALDGRHHGTDLPQRLIPLTELRGLLLHGGLSYETKDRVLGGVAERAQRRDDIWTIGFSGLLMPGLKRVGRRLRQLPGVDADEVGSEVVAALIGVLPGVDPRGERIAASVCWAVYRRSARALGVRRWRESETAWPPGTVAGAAVAATNPEEAITRAVHAGVITEDDAELIAVTRIEGARISELSLALGLPADRLQKRRIRAEARIAELLHVELTRNSTAGVPAVSNPAVVPTRRSGNYRAQPQRRLPGSTATALASIRLSAEPPPMCHLRLRSAAA